MYNGKMKALTFSYDDGVTQDIRFIEILNKYNLKCTFNINSGKFGINQNIVRDDVEITHNKIKEEDIKKIYEGHEVAAHTICHPCLTYLNDWAVIKEKTGIKYARTTTSTHNFDLQDNLFEFKPSVYHHKNWDKMFELAEKFVNLKPEKPQIFYIWGHAYEFDIHNTWDKFEEFCKIVSGKDDVFYGTNKEILLK